MEFPHAVPSREDNERVWGGFPPFNAFDTRQIIHDRQLMEDSDISVNT